MTTVSVDAVDAYINEVRERLTGVPDDERAELLDDVADHVREIAEEFGSDSLDERLGAPADFAAELRASAGYPPFSDVPATDVRPPSALRRGWSQAKRAVWTDGNQATWRKLEPGWFVVRGLLAARLLLAGSHGGLVPRLGNSHLLGLAALVAGAVASYKLGERRRVPQAKWVRRARITAEVLLCIVAFTFINDGHASHENFVVLARPGGKIFPAPPLDGCLRDEKGAPIGNFYAFDATGAPISQFYLTDQAGHPIQNVCPSGVTSDLPRDATGAPIAGMYPLSQTDRATQQRVAGPTVSVPQVAPATTTPAAPPQP